MASVEIAGLFDEPVEEEVTVALVPGDERVMITLEPHKGGQVDLFLTLEETARLATYAAMATEHALRGMAEELHSVWITDPDESKRIEQQRALLWG
jgi:hypothetical protein